MSGIFDISVSAFKNSFDTQGIGDVPLFRFLTSERYRDRIEKLHTLTGQEKSEYKRKHLPCVTPSCTCSPRTEEGVIQHSGFIQFDLDAQDNTWITDWPAERDFMAQIPEVAYCALSSSGRGVWGLVRIKYPDKHKEHFAALEEGFRKNGYVIDQSCKNVTRLRYYSYDPGAKFNYKAPELSRYIDRPRPKVEYVKQGESSRDRQRVEAAIDQIVKRKIDITGSYADWWQIGAAFISAFDEGAALEYFHAVSQFHPDYNTEETQDQFNALLSHKYDFDLAIFFSRCKHFGININSIDSVDCRFEARNGGSLTAAPPPGDSGQGQSHPVQEKARHGGHSAPVVFEDDFTQHIRELAQSETAVNSVLNLAESDPLILFESVHFETRAALARFAEENGTAKLTPEQMKQAGDMFRLLNTSYSDLIEAFGLEYGEPIPLKESAVPF